MISETRLILDIDGIALEACWWGCESDPTLVLLHEGLGSVGLWRDFPARLAARTGLGVFAWSRAGHGRSGLAPSPRPLNYLHLEAERVVGRVLDAAGIGRAILVGHSDGATIAALYAGGTWDPRVRGLVLIAPHYFVETVTVAAIAAARVAYEEGGLRQRMARHHDGVDELFHGWNGAWLNPGFPAVLDLHGHIAHIRVPILQIQGTEDMYGSLDQPRFAEDAAYCPVETVMLAGAGHAPHLESPAPAMDAIADFVERIAAHEKPAR